MKMADTNSYDAAIDQTAKDAYFTASQGQLIWTRFKKQKAAMVAAWVLVVLILSGIFAPFLTPYDPTIAGRDKDYLNGAPPSRISAMTTDVRSGRSFTR